MKRYVIEFHTCVEVEAESKWEAFDKAWQQIDRGDFEFAEPEVVESEYIPRISHARAIPVTPQMRTRSAVYATGNKWAIENFEATH